MSENTKTNKNNMDTRRKQIVKIVDTMAELTSTVRKVRRELMEQHLCGARHGHKITLVSKYGERINTFRCLKCGLEYDVWDKLTKTEQKLVTAFEKQMIRTGE